MRPAMSSSLRDQPQHLKKRVADNVRKEVDSLNKALVEAAMLGLVVDIRRHYTDGKISYSVDFVGEFLSAGELDDGRAKRP